MEIGSIFNRFTSQCVETIREKPIRCALAAIAVIGLLYYAGRSIYNFFRGRKITLVKLDKAERELGEIKRKLSELRLKKLQAENLVNRTEGSEGSLIKRSEKLEILIDALRAPSAKFVFVTGDKHSGKSTLIKQAISEFQKDGYVSLRSIKSEGDSYLSRLNGSNNLLGKVNGVNLDVSDIQTVGVSHENKVIVHIDLCGNSWDDKISSQIEQLLKVFPLSVKFIFECSSAVQSLGTEVSIPSLTPAEKEEIIQKNAEKRFTEMCGISVPEEVIKQTVQTCFRANIVELFTLLERACMREKRKRNSTLDFATVKEVIAIDSKNAVSLPAFLKRVDGAGNRLANRKDVIKEIVQILKLKQEKNNVLLVGHPGIGKTSAVEVLAQLIYDGKIKRFEGFEVYSLSMVDIVKDTSYVGTLEKKVDQLIRFLEGKRDEGVILFIDEIHTLVPRYEKSLTHAVHEGLKPLLAKGVKCIGATTKEDLEQFERDPALARRFFHVEMMPPTPEETKKMLKMIKEERFEKPNGVSIPDDVIDHVVDTAEGFVRYFPDKAIDLLNCAIVATTSDIFETSSAKSDQSDEKVTTLTNEHIDAASSRFVKKSLRQSPTSEGTRSVEELAALLVSLMSGASAPPPS